MFWSPEDFGLTTDLLLTKTFYKLLNHSNLGFSKMEIMIESAQRIVGRSNIRFVLSTESRPLKDYLG